MLAQALLLQFDPERFHQLANYNLLDNLTNRPRGPSGDDRPYNIFDHTFEHDVEAVQRVVEPEGRPWSLAQVVEALQAFEAQGQRAAQILVPEDMRNWIEAQEGLMYQGTFFGAQLRTNPERQIEVR